MQMERNRISNSELDYEPSVFDISSIEKQLKFELQQIFNVNLPLQLDMNCRTNTNSAINERATNQTILRLNKWKIMRMQSIMENETKAS